jgi:pimeloyl-ACP methyl ester carboxylesterase
VKIRDLTTSRLRHSVAEAGAGDPLLLLHGFTGAKEDFADFLDVFADRGWHVVAPDHRGHGASDQPEAESAYSLAAMAADAWAIADELGWERFDLLGHSMGGMVAQVMALQAPHRIRSLVLMDTTHGTVTGNDPDIVALAIAVVRSEGVDRLIELAAEHDTRPKAPADARVRAERPGYVEFGERKMRSCAPAMYAAMADELLAPHDRLPELAGLDVRTLVVVGEQDVEFVAPSQRLAEAVPGAVLEVIADAAHSPQFENPDRWWKVVSRFLDDGRPAPEGDAPAIDAADTADTADTAG